MVSLNVTACLGESPKTVARRPVLLMSEARTAPVAEETMPVPTDIYGVTMTVAARREQRHLDSDQVRKLLISGFDFRFGCRSSGLGI